MDQGATIRLAYLSGSTLNSFVCQYFDDASKLENLMSEMKEYVHKQETTTPPTNLKVGDPVITKFSNCNLLYRGQILTCDLSSSIAEVLFIDYGYTESVSISDLIAIPSQFTVLKKQAVTCCLSTRLGTTFEKWPREAFSKFQELALGDKCLTATVVRSGAEKLVVHIGTDTCSDLGEYLSSC